MLVAALLGVVAGVILRPLLAVVPVFALAGWLFHSLTIGLGDGELRWRFGPGLVRKQVRLDTMASARVVRTGFGEGWGIHYGRFGWLYNVSGCDAVVIQLKNGRQFALGTDEPQQLLAAIQTALETDRARAGPGRGWSG